MSKERARRRVEREAEAARERERRSRQQARAARRRGLTSRASGVLRRPAEPDSALARQRRRQNGTLLAVLLGLHAVIWLFEPSWLWRGSALVLTVVAWPLLVVLFFDRRSST